MDLRKRRRKNSEHEVLLRPCYKVGMHERHFERLGINHVFQDSSFKSIHTFKRPSFLARIFRPLFDLCGLKITERITAKTKIQNYFGPLFLKYRATSTIQHISFFRLRGSLFIETIYIFLIQLLIGIQPFIFLCKSIFLDGIF